MKLQRVVLTKPRRLPGMAGHEHEITDKECPDLRYDEKLGVVVIGDVHIPREQVAEWERDNDMLVCPEPGCGEEFANAQGLGGHRRKHATDGFEAARVVKTEHE